MFKHCEVCNRLVGDGHRHPRKYVNRPRRATQARKIRNTERSKQLAIKVKRANNWLCQNCAKQGKYTYQHLEAHHKKPISTHPELAYDEDNLEVLCKECHQLEHQKPPYL